MGTRISSLPQGSQTDSVVVPGNQQSQTRKVTIAPPALGGAASDAEMLAGVLNNKTATPHGVDVRVKHLDSDTGRQWRDWVTPLTINQSNTGGTGLATGLPVFTSQTRFSPNATDYGGTGIFLRDVALLYVGAFAAGFNPPTAPSASDTWLTGLFVRHPNASATMLVRWQLGGVRIYHAPTAASPVWSELASDDASLITHPRSMTASDGWQIAAEHALELPPTGTNADLVDIPWAVRFTGNFLYALALGYTGNSGGFDYRTALTSREYIGAAVTSVKFTIANLAADIPASPAAGALVWPTATFVRDSVSWVAGRPRYWTGSQWTLLAIDADSINSGTLDLGQLGGAFGNIGKILESTGTVWHQADKPIGFPTTGGLSGQVVELRIDSNSNRTYHYVNHGKTIHEVIQGQVIPANWEVGNWVWVNATNEVTLTYGTASQILNRRGLYRIAALGLNPDTLTMTEVDINGANISGAQSIPSNILAAKDNKDAANAAAGRVLTANGSGVASWQELPNDIPLVDNAAELPSSPATDDAILIGANFTSGGVSFWSGRVYRYSGTAWAVVPRAINATDITSGTLSADRIPTLAIGTKTSGDLPASRIDGRLALSNLPTNLPTGTTLPLAADLNTLWHSPGVYRVRPGTPNSHDEDGSGILLADYNSQTIIASGDDAGESFNRSRAIDLQAQGIFATLAADSLFTRITDMSTDLNDITDYGYYYWHSASPGGTGNVAGTDRPTNSPGYAGITGSVGNYQRSAFGEFREDFQIVATGGSWFNAGGGTLLFRRKNVAGTLWQNTWTQVDFSSANVAATLTLIHPFFDDGLRLVRHLRQLPDDDTTDLYWVLPDGAVANHPDGSTNRIAPMLCRYTLVSNTRRVLAYYNYGVPAGTGADTEPRVKSIPFDETASAWVVKSDSVTGGSYSSSNGTLTLTRDYGANLTITGLPYVTSS